MPRDGAKLSRMAMLRQIVIDSDNPAVLARFWAAALDDFDVLPYDDAEIARLAALGFTPETDPCVIVGGPGLELCFQRIDETRHGKRPLHLDIAAVDRTREVERLVALGASVRQHFDDHDWLVDPEGNDFCITEP